MNDQILRDISSSLKSIANQGRRKVFSASDDVDIAAAKGANAAREHQKPLNQLMSWEARQWNKLCKNIIYDEINQQWVIRDEVCAMHNINFRSD